MLSQVFENSSNQNKSEEKQTCLVSFYTYIITSEGAGATNIMEHTVLIDFPLEETSTTRKTAVCLEVSPHKT